MIFTRDSIIGGIILLVVLIGIVWYALSQPPATEPPAPTATSTPATATGPLHITEKTDLYTVDAQYPSGTVLAATAGADADAKAVLIMKTFDENTIEAFKESFVDLPDDLIQRIHTDGFGGSLEIDYKTYQSSGTVSYIFTIFQDTLGAHPNTFYRTFSFNTSSGAGLTLGDVFNPGTDYLSQLSKISKAQLPAIIAERENVSPSEIDMDMLEAGTTADEDNWGNWYLDGSNLVIIFPPYQIGPYVLGSTVFPIPLSQLSGVKAEYK